VFVGTIDDRFDDNGGRWLRSRRLATNRVGVDGVSGTACSRLTCSS
jgi:hypothetical protein